MDEDSDKRSIVQRMRNKIIKYRKFKTKRNQGKKAINDFVGLKILDTFFQDSRIIRMRWSIKNESSSIS